MPGKKRTIIAGNWKMHKSIEETREFIHTLAPQISDSKNQVFLAIPYTAIQEAAKAAQGKITIGAQNMHWASEGAFTGEISGKMLKDAGAKFVILGHSERRTVFGEENRVINKKILHALEVGLQPLVCVGETEKERERGLTEEILDAQLTQCFEGVKEKQMKQIVLAYEPVWAIGTGLTATPQQAQEMHLFCRELLANRYAKDVIEHLPILYGGSVNPSNIRSLLEQPDIDGALVGGASLSVDSFSQIVNYQTINV
jgi:triosephosphate isomerase